MNLNQLRFVRAVADAGTFTGGAGRCHVTQSTLSTGIAHLERELGERLFARTTRAVNLTQFGRRLLPLIDEVLRAEAALVEGAESFLDPQSRSARIGVCPLVDSVRLELILAPYRKGNRNVRLVLEQIGDGKAWGALEEGRLDCILGPSHRAAGAASPARRPALERPNSTRIPSSTSGLERWVCTERTDGPPCACRTSSATSFFSCTTPAASPA